MLSRAGATRSEGKAAAYPVFHLVNFFFKKAKIFYLSLSTQLSTLFFLKKIILQKMATRERLFCYSSGSQPFFVGDRFSVSKKILGPQNL